MATPGNDPFSGTTTRNLLQHIISPKVISDGTGGYKVKTDLINIDKSYTDELVIQDTDVPNSDILTLSTSTTSSNITSTTSSGNPSVITLVASEVHVDNPDTTTSATLLLESDTNGNGFIQAGLNGDGSEKLSLGTANHTSTIEISNTPAVTVNASTVYIDNPATVSSAQLILNSATNGDGYIRAGNGGAGTETLYLGTGSTNTVTVTPSGSVGIGNSAPSYTLDVTGNMHTTTNIKSDTDIQVGGSSTAGMKYNSAAVFYSNNTVNGTNRPIQFQQTNTSTTSTPVTIDATGCVGIGTTTPATRLHVIGDAKNYLTNPWGDAAFGSNGQEIIQSQTDATRRLALGYCYLGPTGAIDCGIIGAIQSSISTKHLLLNPNGNTGTGFIGIGGISSVAATGPTGPTEPLNVAGNVLINGGRSTNNSQLFLGPSVATNNYDSCSLIRSTPNTAVNASSELSFWTHPAASNSGLPTRAMTINSIQQIGINTATPYYTVDIAGQGADLVIGAQSGASKNDGLFIEGYTGSGYIRAQKSGGTLYLGAGSTNTVLITEAYTNIYTNPVNIGSASQLSVGWDSANGVVSLKSTNNGGTPYYPMYFQQGNTTTVTTPMMINASGNVGVGTLTPTTKLQVAGSFNCTGDFTGKSFGTVTANNGTGVTVTNTNVTASSIILLTVKTATGANAGQAYVSSTSVGASFTIKSGAADTSVYNYMILN